MSSEIRPHGLAAVLPLLIILSVARHARGADEPPGTDRLLRQIKSGQVPGADAAVKTILGQRSRLIASLIALCDRRCEEGTRAAAMYALGKMRAVEACPVLTKCIAFTPGPAFGGKKPAKVVALFGGSPARDALVAIGKPAVRGLIEAIKQSDQSFVRHQCRSAITGIEGFAYARQLLADAIRQEDGPATK